MGEKEIQTSQYKIQIPWECNVLTGNIVNNIIIILCGDRWLLDLSW